MMIDRVLAVVSIACLFGFLGIIVWFVPAPDLIIVTVIVLAMALFDFYRSTFGNGPPS